MLTKLKEFTIADIRSWGPCYDPNKYLPENWKGSTVDILKIQAIPAEDRLWVVCREELIDSRTLRMFAVYCAREALKLVPEPDPRSVAACDVAERFANGKADGDELAAAWAAAAAAAWAAAGDAAAQIKKLIEMLEA